RALRLVAPVSQEIHATDVVSSTDLAKVSIVGTGMQHTPGYAARMFRALADAGINIEMITTSEIRITCLIAASQVARAVQALHDAFQLDRADL
ncbi:MAG: ACT domain-containing protein, partial [Chloroflexi bacterium]|nr:ACT domain-containing protein [Chloroflexota bacterium]